MNRLRAATLCAAVPSALSFTVHDGNLPPEAALVDAGIDEFNSQEPALADVKPLVVLCRGKEGHLLGGAVGRTWGGCGELQQLWVSREQRMRGIGSALMRQFEHAASTRGVGLLYLYTFTFQAPAFYTKCGFSVALELSGFGPGISKFTMVKSLSPRTTGT